MQIEETMLVETDENLFEEIIGGITAPKGFKTGGIYAGIRKIKKDLAIIYSEKPAHVAGVFTLNKACAAPISVCKTQLKNSPTCSALVVNSGNANACTGERGMQDALEMVQATASALHVPFDQVWVASTGVIGQFMPIEKIAKGISDLAPILTSSAEASQDAAEAIMTTDTFKKEIAIRFELGGKNVTIGAIAKGSGMIAPNMATMLAFVTTDAAIAQPLLQKALSASNKKSFNRISVDGDCSTNDMVSVMANGIAGNPFIQSESEDFKKFCNALDFVLIKMAKLIARDGEGATKFVEIIVSGAKTESEAEQAARSVANSNLVKTAIHGEDANWGRIIAAVGYSGIDFNPDHTEVSFGDVPILKKNYEIVLDEAKAKEVLKKDTVTIYINLNQGEASATFWTCDLTQDYIKINASYRS